MVPDLLSGLADVRPSAEHALVGHHSDSEVVDCGCVVLPAHDFRSHVPWCPRGILGVLSSPNSRNSEISDADVAVIVDDKILWLDISMDDLLLVAVLKPCYQTSNEEL